MTAEAVYQIAIHLSEKEMEKLYDMLGKKITPQISVRKKKSTPVVSDHEAIKYLLKNVFCKMRV
jgi:hypothetical protein